MHQGVGIQLRGIRKAFGDQQVLNGVDLDVPRGRITVVIGRSGSGKSVLLKHVMGLIHCDAGSVRVGDDELSTLSRTALRLVRFRFGMVFQNAALFDSLNVFENIAFPLREHGSAGPDGRSRRMTEREIGHRVEQMLASVGLSGMGRKGVSELSGGMRKRVGLARALVRSPEFLLYDEPTTGLDPIMTAQIDNLIRSTQDANPGITSLVISHDMAATFRIADHVAMLHDGAVRLHGTPNDFRSTADPVVRQFVEGRLDGPIRT
ncbi:MAG: ATP-binding cassette domain-containing protein [Myxococcales bacterium]|nr:ATP-binding cassette domain-containing protein [Myxococcales bacterium]